PGPPLNPGRRAPAYERVCAAHSGAAAISLERTDTMRSRFLTAALVLALAGACRFAGADAINKTIPPPATDTPAAEVKGSETAVLAGGCFWGLQGMFEHVK